MSYSWDNYLHTPKRQEAQRGTRNPQSTDHEGGPKRVNSKRGERGAWMMHIKPSWLRTKRLKVHTSFCGPAGAGPYHSGRDALRGVPSNVKDPCCPSGHRTVERPIGHPSPVRRIHPWSEHAGVPVREGPRTATGRSPATVQVAARRPGRAVRSPPTQSHPDARLRESTKHKWRRRRIDKAPNAWLALQQASTRQLRLPTTWYWDALTQKTHDSGVALTVPGRLRIFDSSNHPHAHAPRDWIR